ncbi:MAG: MATE family efflux transporter [Bacilli bacterium]|nr:MATE family efflux transporter [Bacilli bacterium]
METTLKQQKRLANKDFTTGNLAKKIVLYFIPVFLSAALSLLFTTMDLFTVAQFGDGNLSSGAIGSTVSLINIILSVFIGLSSGASVVVANAKGENNKEKLLKSIGTTILLTIFLGIAIQIFGVFCSRPLLILLNTDTQLLDKASLYLFIYFIGAPFNLLFQCGAAIFRALGDSKRPLVAILAGGIINIAFNFMTVIGFHLDVAGVAIATVASQIISTIIVFLFLFKDKQFKLHFSFRHIRYHHDVGRDIIRLGIASALQSLIFNITNVAIQASINSISTAAVIGKSAAANIEGYEYALLNSISITCSITTAQNYGAKNKERVKKSLIYCIIYELVVVTLTDLIIFLLRDPLLKLFITQNEATTADAMHYGYLYLLIIGIPYAICGIAECFSGYLRGLKYSLTPTLVSLFSIVGFRLIFIFCFFNLLPQFHNFESLMALYPLSWTLCCLIYIPITIVYTKRTFTKIPLKAKNKKMA